MARLKLTWNDVEEIRRSSLKVNQLAEKYGVDRRTIYKVRSGKTWNRDGRYKPKSGKDRRLGEKHHGSVFTEEQVIAIYQDPRTAFEISIDFDFDVTTSAIYGIKQGKRWKWLTKDLKKPEKVRRVNSCKLHPDTVKIIYQLAGTYRLLAERFGCSSTTIGDIKCDRTWTHLTKDLEVNSKDFW